jgi:hypothetical protein
MVPPLSLSLSWIFPSIFISFLPQMREREGAGELLSRSYTFPPPPPPEREK